jgi:putative spermidine/putrescine transport system permease protein
MRRYIDRVGFSLVVTVVGAATVFLLLPLLVVFFMAFDARTFLGPFPPSSFSLQWFERLFSNEFIRNGIKTSLLLAVTTTLISTVIGVTAALAIHRREFNGKALLTAFLFSPIIVPAVVIGFAILLVFTLVDIRVAFLRLLAAHVIITLPFVIRAVMASLAGLRPSLVEAAMSLGATEGKAFFTVTLPLVRPGIVAGMIFAFALSMDDVAASLFLTDQKTVTLPVVLVSLMRANFDLTLAAAAVLLVAVTMVIVFVLDRIYGIDRVVGTTN